MRLLEPHPDAFPADPPAHPDDPQAVAAHDWDAFSQVDKTTNHWERPGWTPDTRAYYWLLTMPSTAFGDQIPQLQHAINHLPYDPIPDDGIHLTLGRVGTEDTTTRTALYALLNDARVDLPPAFTLTAVPITASRGAVRYSVAPWTPLLTLHAHLARVTAAHRLGPMAPTSRLRPHIGVAYSASTRPAADIHAALAPMRALPPVTLGVTAVALVAMRREPGAYRWDVVAELPLPRS
ncbi:2'-5' RNA ligase family protein [Streptomyces sp. NPDC004549]|uniref:2'-5' RNA ligase family protein n=1 Tax=Streptomyces sp. NPDC004549 TaxID=3154283 RepID=UPI0033A9FB4E